MEKLIITAALSGAETSREDNPNLPVSVEEIAEAGLEAAEAGASILHLHMRNEKGEPSQDPELFKEAKTLIQKESDVILQFSTGGAVGMSIEERIGPLSLQPEMATLTTGTVNFGREVFYNPPEFVEAFAKKMRELKIKPEIEVFDSGMIGSALYLLKKGLLLEPLHFDLVMGVPGGIGGEVKDLLYLVEKLPSGSSFSVAGVGRYELPLGVMAILMGGHVRVGFEDNIFYKKGILAESNAQLVSRMKRLSHEMDRDVATPREAREILGMAKED